MFHFLPVFNPLNVGYFATVDYYWTLWQSEWATDLIFDSPDSLKAPMDALLRHAHIIGTITRVLRYPDRPLTKAH